jgi:hypothetical protein
VLIYENNAEELILNINNDQIYIKGDYIQDLPEIYSIGYTYKGEYVDLTENYINANFTTINYV